MSRKLSTRDLEELLESDDELPDTYEEVPEVPAYQNDKRFDTFQFSSLEKKEWPALCKSKQNSSFNQSTNQQKSYPVVNKEAHATRNILLPKPEKKLHEPEKATKILMPERIFLVKRGVLSKQDLLCVKALISISTDLNIMWFINFLMRKDMQDKYKFLKSCLIEDLRKTTPVSKKTSKSEVKKFKYELNLL